MRLAPLNACPKTGIHARTGSERKLPLGLAGVQTSARLAVWLACVPMDLSDETSKYGDLLSQALDRNFLTATEIDWIGAVISFGCHNYALGSILNIQELAGRRTVAPQGDLSSKTPIRLQTLADNGRD